MKLIGAAYDPRAKTTRFLFTTADEKDPNNSSKWVGQALVFRGIESMSVLGEETDLRELADWELERYCGALCQDGGIDVGFGVSGNVCDIVHYDGAKLLFHIVFNTFTYYTGIPLAKLLTVT